MGYEPTNWKTGDVITAEKLNKIENGIGSGGGGASEMVFKTDVSFSNGSTVACNYTVAQVTSMQIDALPICKLVLGTSNVYYGLWVQTDVDMGGFSCTVMFQASNDLRYVVSGSTSRGEWTIRKLNA